MKGATHAGPCSLCRRSGQMDSPHSGHRGSDRPWRMYRHLRHRSSVSASRVVFRCNRWFIKRAIPTAGITSTAAQISSFNACLKPTDGNSRSRKCRNSIHGKGWLDSPYAVYTNSGLQKERNNRNKFLLLPIIYFYRDVPESNIQNAQNLLLRHRDSRSLCSLLLALIFAGSDTFVPLNLPLKNRDYDRAASLEIYFAFICAKLVALPAPWPRYVTLTPRVFARGFPQKPTSAIL